MLFSPFRGEKIFLHSLIHRAIIRPWAGYPSLRVFVFGLNGEARPTMQPSSEESSIVRLCPGWQALM